jgi:hypothetical protein
MGKTNFAALMQVPSAFMNKIFNTGGGHKHDDLDQDGSAGKISPATEIDGTGASKGMVVVATSDATPAWGNPAAIRDIARGLVIKNNTTNPLYQVDIDADEILLKDANGTPIIVENPNETIDLSTSGAGGLDTGSEAPSTWYYYYLIAKSDGTVAGLFSTSSTAPTMPSGYTYKALLGAVYNNSSSDLDAFHQLGNKVTIPAQQVINGGNATSYTSVDLSTVVPSTAKQADLYWGSDTSSSSTLGTFASDTSGKGSTPNQNGNTSNIFESVYGPVNIKGLLLITAQTAYYKLINSSTTIDAYVTGWEY